jgi:GT2 family glycosyltransferase
MHPHVAIITVLFNNASDIEGYYQSIKKIDYPQDKISLYVIDNNSSDESFRLAGLHSTDLRFHHTMIQSKENTGFVGGNNQAFEKIKKTDTKYTFLLNPDTEIEPDCISKLVTLLESNSEIGAAQPLVLTLQDKTKINTAGNVCHYLGFSMVKDNNAPRSSIASRTAPYPVMSLSGAAFFLRNSCIREDEPLLDEALFAYHEDFELSLRLQVQGYSLYVEPHAVVYHRYTFGKGKFKFYLIERNRIRVILSYYSLTTLLRLAPMLLLTEGAMFGFSLLSGWANKKVLAWMHTLTSLPSILKRRKYIQTIKKVSDSDLIKNMDASLSMPDRTPFVVSHLYNPLSEAYKKFLFSR